MNGIINVLKPPGMTSHDVINFFRRTLGFPKAGHTGTLDPGAAGVLPVCVGKATKIADFIMEGTKTYRAGIRLGISTDTLDSYGLVVGRSEVSINEKQLNEVIETFKGSILQVPPMYSAIKKDGKRLYDIARKGGHVRLEPRKVEIYSLKIVSINIPDEIIIDVDCSKGTYIRSLCEDIGKKLGCCAHMSFLIRTKNGIFGMEEAYTLEKLKQLKQEGELNTAFLLIDSVLESYQPLSLSDNELKKFLNGVTFAIQNNNPGIKRIYNNGKFIGLGTLTRENDKGYLKIKKLLS